MHHIYHTEGILLSSRSSGEAGKYYSIFTRDLGMIHATATGVRKLSSKLRYVLTDYAYVKVDLVKGKDIWRITSASKTNELEMITENKETLAVFTKVARLLERLLAGEDPNEKLFDDVLQGLFRLEKLEAPEDLRNMEALIVLRILHNLGYIGDTKELHGLIESPYEENLVLETAKSRTKILFEINKALKETHL